MHAIPENAQLKAVASPIPTVHSHTSGDCTPPVYMPPTPVMNRYEAQSAAHEAHMLGISTGNRPLAHAARALYYDLEDSHELSPVEADNLYACIVAATEATMCVLPLNHPARKQASPAATSATCSRRRNSPASPIPKWPRLRTHVAQQQTNGKFTERAHPPHTSATFKHHRAIGSRYE